MTRPAVLLVIFRRPDVTAKVMEALRRDRPPRLYVAADGPRANKVGEAELCAETRRLATTIDWPCEVKTFFRDENVGVRRGVSEAISWFFDHEEEGVIFEDDCVPGPEFLDFCATNLERYRHDPRVMQISGTNFQPNRRGASSHFFSRYAHVWGWATWRRAWALYQADLDPLKRVVEIGPSGDSWDSAKEQKYWRYIYQRLAQGAVESWAYRWQFSLWLEGGLVVYPEASLVLNQGFGCDATNTREGNATTRKQGFAALPTTTPPAEVERNRAADRYTFRHMYWGSPWARWTGRWQRLVRKVVGFQ